MKRNFLLASVITFCLALVLSFVAFNPVTAYAEGEGAATVTLNKTNAYTYKMEYLANEAGDSMYNDKTTVKVNGVEFAKTTSDLIEAHKTAGFYAADSKSIEFLKNDTYTITLHRDEVEADNPASEYNFNFAVNTTAKPVLWEDLKYDYDTEALNAYKTEVEEATQKDGVAIKVDDDYEVPCITSLLSDKYFDVESLSGTLYYAVPGSSYTSKSISDLDNVKFEVSKIGVYKFYILVENDFAEMTTEDLIEDVGGWYKTNDEGEKLDDNVVVPVFSFEVTSSTAPKISVGNSEKAYIGLKYTVKSFTIVASDYETDYTLYYSENELTAEQIGDDYSKATLLTKGLTEVTKENEFTDANLFDEATKSFTPEKKGFYYVVCHVKDFANEDATLICNAINAQSELKQVKYEKEFFKYNWLSIVLLSIAVICFVAILLLLFVKPKENNANVTKK